MTLGQKQRLFTRLLAELIRYTYDELGHELSLGEATRTREQQDWYVQAGKSRTRHSRHLQRLAIDLNLFCGGVYQQKSEAYLPLGEYWESLHPDCVWGGRWTNPVDGNHFEMRP